MGTFRLLAGGLVAFSVLAIWCNFAMAGDVGKAKRDLMFAKDNAESERWDDLDTNMKKAATDMEGLSDAEKAPLLAQLAEIKATVTKSVEDDVNKRLDKAAKADPGMGKLDIDRASMRVNSEEAKNYADPAAMDKLRAKIAKLTGGSATPPKENTTTTPPRDTTTTGNPPKAMSDELAMAAAKAHSARNLFDQSTHDQDFEMADSFQHDAMKLLNAVNDPNKAPIVADMIALGKQIDEALLKIHLKEEFDRVDGQMHRYVSDADSGIMDGVVVDADRINKAQDLLDTDDIKTYMDAEHIKAYQVRIDALRVRLKAHNKEVALQRSAPILKELEDSVAADPFKGVQDQSIYGVYSNIKTLSDRVRGEFYRVPKDDPEIKAVLDRVTAAGAKMEAAAGKYAIQKMQEQFARGWKLETDQFAGWESETLAPGAIAQRRVLGLNKTMQAVSGTVYWLNDADTKATAAKYKDNAVVAATLQSATKTLDDASAKLNEAFNAVIADAESKPMPTREADRTEIGNLAHDAEHWFAGTKYKDADVARASALDAKWKADVARAEKEMEETLKKLSAEADAAWPKIEATVNAEKGFDPKDVAQWKGKTIEIKGYYNRSGWDYDGAYDYAVGIKGVPVAGMYEPNVRAAFDEGSRHTKFGINDHMGWDVIAVVEGKGEIKRRTITEVKDKDTHEIVLKVESYVPEPCVVIKIIGLHAGPVAVGPK